MDAAGKSWVKKAVKNRRAGRQLSKRADWEDSPKKQLASSGIDDRKWSRVTRRRQETEV